MNRKQWQSSMSVAVAALTFFIATPVSAQWRVTGIGVGEIDTKQTLLLLAGLSATTGGRGLSPIIGVQAYHLGYDAGATRTNVLTVKPYVGLGNNYGSGSVSGTVGYSFSNKTTGPVLFSGSSADPSEGVVVSGAWDHWGSGSPWGHQVLGSYNFESESFWGRGRVTRRISGNAPAQHRFGGEVAYLTGTGYSAVQPGAVLELHDGHGRIIGLGAGMKFFGNGGGNAVYFKAEAVFPVVR